MKDGAQAAAKIAQDLGAQVGKSSAFRGLLTLAASFFMMPIHSAKIAVQLLREIGEKGALDTGTQFPHLKWIMTVLPLIATIGFVSVIFLGWSKGAQLLDNEYVQAGLDASGYKQKIITQYTFLTLLGAYATNWVIMFFGELLGVIMRNYENHRAQLNALRGLQAADISKLAASASKRES